MINRNEIVGIQRRLESSHDSAIEKRHQLIDWMANGLKMEAESIKDAYPMVNELYYARVWSRERLMGTLIAAAGNSDVLFQNDIGELIITDTYEIKLIIDTMKKVVENGSRATQRLLEKGDTHLYQSALDREYAFVITDMITMSDTETEIKPEADVEVRKRHWRDNCDENYWLGKLMQENIRDFTRSQPAGCQQGLIEELHIVRENIEATAQAAFKLAGLDPKKIQPHY